jgi:hypothetical protein
MLFAIALFLPGFAFAQNVVINEVAWMGAPVEGIDAKQEWRYEWIELYNAGDEAIELRGWRIELYSRERLDFTIMLYGSVEAKEYFLVGASDKIPGVDVNYSTLTGKLTNSGQTLVLKDAAGAIVEQIDASSGWFAGDNDLKLTMERRFPNRPANDPANWGSSQTSGGTPKAQNSLFEKEKFIAFQQSSSLIKKEPLWASFLPIASNTIFIRAFLVALGCSVAILALRRYLIGHSEQAEGSSGALKG